MLLGYSYIVHDIDTIMHRYIYYIIGAREKGTKGGSFPGVIGRGCGRLEPAQRIAGYFYLFRA